MKVGVLVAVGVALAATAGLTTIFVNNASPYLTIKEVADQPNKAHVVGKLVPDTLKQNVMQRETLFTMQDETGTMKVRYTGPPQSNLEHADKVVVIGKMKDGTFHSEQMLVKCPSKYESETKQNG